MKKAILLIFLLSMFLSGQAQNSVYPDAPFTKLYQINVAGNNIFAAGGCDIVMLSQDGGNQWETLEMSTYRLENIEIVPNTDGKKAYLLYSSKINILDIETKMVEDISDDNLNSLRDNFKKLMIRGDSLYLLDDAGIFRSKIGEYAWDLHMGFSFDEGYILREDYSENYFWLGMSTGKVFKVHITDKTLTEVYEFERRVFNVEMVDDSTGYFTYQTGSQIYKTEDSGETFFPLDGMPETATPLALGRDILMTINTNRIYLSTDGGVSSRYIGMPKDGMTTLVGGHCIVEDTTLYLVGESGMVLKTDDLGDSFTQLNPFNRENLQSIDFNENGEGYAVGGYYNVVRTTDGGNSWSFMDWGIENNFYQSVVAAGSNRFLIASDVGTLIVENGMVVDTYPGASYALYKSPISNTIYLVRHDSGLKLSKTEDYGDTWTELSPLSNSSYHLHQTDSGKLYSVNSDRQLIVTSDEGSNWEILPLTGLEGNVSSFYFINDNHGIISAGLKLYRTTDGGNTASLIANNYSIENVYMLSDEHFIYTYATNDQTSIQETTDAGQNWSSTGSFCSRSFGSYFDGDRTIWYAQKGGHINKHLVLETSGFFNKATTESTLEVYPNPVQEGQYLNFKLDSDEDLVVRIFDIAGKVVLIETVTSGKQQLHLGGIHPGTYLVETINDKGYRHSAKLIIQ